MRITVDRIKSNDDATLSIISTQSGFECFGLEDEYREDKIANETRIPGGLYKIRLKPHGRMHERYQRKFYFHQGMLHLQDVPGFTDILIHIGNTDDDTAGCLLVGSGCDSAELRLTKSTYAYMKLYKKVVQAAAEHDLDILIIDND